MNLSPDRLSHLAHLLKDGALRKGLIETRDSLVLLKVTKEVLKSFFKTDNEIDDLVRKKLSSYSRNITEGSREWDILYQKHFEEEMKKRS